MKNPFITGFFGNCMRCLQPKDWRFRANNLCGHCVSELAAQKYDNSL